LEGGSVWRRRVGRWGVWACGYGENHYGRLVEV
jgi:hypothetical protein